MGTGYTRNDTADNIADGKVAQASDLDGEFNAIEAAFVETTGHTHDGTADEGAPIEVVGPAQDYVAGASSLSPKTDSTYSLGTSSLQWSNVFTDAVEVVDSGFKLQDGADRTKQVTFEVSDVTTSTTRTVTIPDSDLVVVGTTLTQTLTNKTIDAASNTLTGVVTLTGTQTLTNKTLTQPAITGTITEDVYALSGTSVALEPDNGSVQTHTLTANTTYTDAISAGEGITLMLDDGTAYTVTWPTITWVNNAGAAPTLATSGYTVVAIWKVATTLYGALVGDGT